MNIDLLKYHFDYDHITGLLSRKYGRFAGKRVGWKHKETSHIYFRFQNKQLLAHRVAWAIFYGEIPSNEIDHINGIGDDNRIINLRVVDHRTNQENRRKAQKNNKLGLLGVVSSKDKFIAQIHVNKKLIYLGTFENKNDAADAYIKAKRAMHSGCTI